MKNTHIEKITVDDTNIDYELKVPVIEMVRMLEISTFNHADKIGLDHDSMIRDSNAFWVVSKMKLVIKGDIHSQDKLTIKTWTHVPGMLRFNRDCVLKVKNSVKAKATAEWCCLDYETRKVRKASTVKYPDLEMVEKKELNLQYTNLRLDLSEADYVYTRKIRTTDIDVNNHTNNLKYNYIAFDALNIDELRSIDIKEYEIYFVNESRYNDEIKVYKKKVKDCYYIESKIEDKTIFRVVIKFKKKKEI